MTRDLIATYCPTHGMHDGQQCPRCARDTIAVLEARIADQAVEHQVLRERVAGIERRLTEAETLINRLTELPMGNRPVDIRRGTPLPLYGSAEDLA